MDPYAMSIPLHAIQAGAIMASALTGAAAIAYGINRACAALAYRARCASPADRARRRRKARERKYRTPRRRP